MADYYAENDYEALDRIKSILKYVNYKKLSNLDEKVISPKYDPIDIYGIVPSDLREQYDVREIISRIVDNSEFEEFKINYGTTLVTGFSYILGLPVGVIANNGILFSESSLKGAHFIQLCEQRRIPILFLQNISGFMIGKKFEERGIAKDGAKISKCCINSNCPQNYNYNRGFFWCRQLCYVCGRAYSPRFLFSWPNSKISVMGGEIAAKVLASVKDSQTSSSKKKWDIEEKNKFMKAINDKFEKRVLRIMLHQDYGMME